LKLLADAEWNLKGGGIMTKVLNIHDRLKDKQQKEQINAFREKVETLQRTVQCSLCPYKCAMCGQHLHGEDEADAPAQPASNPLNLCDQCKSEFDAFIRVSKRGRKPEFFWQNQEWIHLWSSWLEYRKALGAFRETAEFDKLNQTLAE
jgi:hypothetical protein